LPNEAIACEYKSLKYNDVDDAAALKLSLSPDERRLTFVKELIPVGHFSKPGECEFTITEELLDHWSNQVGMFLSQGIRIPVPKEHSFDPEDERGELVGAFKGTNDRGEPSLFGYVRFRDEESAKMAGSVDVSVYVPPEWEDSLGNYYVRPIKHVALTSYPIIPGLGRFQAIAASYSYHGDIDMSLVAIAQTLGIQNPEAMQGDQLAMAVNQAIKGLVDENRRLKAGPKPQQPQQAAAAPPVPGGGGAPAPAAPAAPPQQRRPVAASGMSPQLMLSFRSLLHDNRAAKIDALVGKHITPACAKDLKEHFCKEDSLTLSLSSSKDGKDREFDAMIAGLKKNQSLELGEKTGRQDGGKDDPTVPHKSMLVQDAERRAKMTS
jgi:hypothetical protein